MICWTIGAVLLFFLLSSVIVVWNQWYCKKAKYEEQQLTEDFLEALQIRK